MPAQNLINLGLPLSFRDKLLWAVAWSPRVCLGLTGALSVTGGLMLHSWYGLLLGVGGIVVWSRGVHRINSCAADIRCLAEELVRVKSWERVGAGLHNDACVTVSVPEGIAPFGIKVLPLSERLGHSSVRVTADIYSHALRGRDRDAARRYDDFMRRNGAVRQEGKGSVN